MRQAIAAHRRGCWACAGNPRISVAASPRHPDHQDCIETGLLSIRTNEATVSRLFHGQKREFEFVKGPDQSVPVVMAVTIESK